MEETKMKYYAFISYKREDEKWAKWLQHRLESYRLPASIRTQDVSIPKYIRPIFRDNTDLSGTVLQDSLDDGLLHSKYLIVICSPHVVESEWVAKEIRQFIDSGRLNHIIPFVVDGVPMSADPAKECFPQVLRDLPKDQELLGINVQELGREKALVRTVSTLMGIRFDAIWDRHRRRVVRNRILGGILAFLLLLGALFAWDYNRPTYRYFADYVDSYGVPEGILPLTSSQVSHRGFSYRFEYRRIPFGQPGAYSWRVSRVDNVDSHGSPCMITDAEIRFRAPSVGIEYYENGSVSRLVYYNEKGHVIYRQILSERHGKQAAVADFLSAEEQLGTRFSISEVASEFLDWDNTDFMAYLEKSNSSIARFAYERDARGHITAVTFHSSNDHDLVRSATCDVNGIFGLEFRLDTLGRPVRVTYLDKDHHPQNDRSGVVYKTYSYSASGVIREVTCYDHRDSLVLNAAMWAKRASELDDNGNEKRMTYYDTHGKPMLNKGLYASVSINCNQNGDSNSALYLGADGQPCINAFGFSLVKLEFDSEGREISENFFDTHGRPCIAELGYARKTLRYDRHGNVSEECYYDTEGRRCATDEGLSRWVKKYDSRDNLIEEKYFDVDDRPCAWTEGYHHCVTVYNEYNLPIEERYYDTDEKPCANTNGIARIVAVYDDRGNVVCHNYYDAQGRLTKTLDGGYAIWEGEYDDLGNRIRKWMRDEQGNICLNTQGYAGMENRYDEQGRTVYTTYLGTEKQPLMREEGYASVSWEYNDCGDIVSIRFFDEHKKPCLTSEGYTRWEGEYTSNGELFKETIYGLNGAVVPNVEPELVHHILDNF